MPWFIGSEYCSTHESQQTFLWRKWNLNSIILSKSQNLSLMLFDWMTVTAMYSGTCSALELLSCSEWPSNSWGRSDKVNWLWIESKPGISLPAAPFCICELNESQKVQQGSSLHSWLQHNESPSASLEKTHTLEDRIYTGHIFGLDELIRNLINH